MGEIFDEDEELIEALTDCVGYAWPLPYVAVTSTSVMLYRLSAQI
jgi:hypothetical protein